MASTAWKVYYHVQKQWSLPRTTIKTNQPHSSAAPLTLSLPCLSVTTAVNTSDISAREPEAHWRWRGPLTFMVIKRLVDGCLWPHLSLPPAVDYALLLNWRGKWKSDRWDNKRDWSRSSCQNWHSALDERQSEWHSEEKKRANIWEWDEDHPAACIMKHVL